MAGESDAWQPVESRVGVTRYVLEKLSSFRFGYLLLSTRSPIIRRDIDLLAALAPRVLVGVSISTDLDDVRKLIEPCAPTINNRFETARILRSAGIPLRIHVAPLLKHSPDFVSRLFDVVSSVWVDFPDPKTPRWDILCRRIGRPEGLDPKAYLAFTEQLKIRFGVERVGLGRDDFALCGCTGFSRYN